MTDLHIGSAATTDLAAVLDFWRAAAEGTSISDDLAGVERLHERDPGALLLARRDGELVGTVIAGFDGWRCHLYRLAVHPGHRRQGIGAALLAAAEERFVALGGRRGGRDGAGPQRAGAPGVGRGGLPAPGAVDALGQAARPVVPGAWSSGPVRRPPAGPSAPLTKVRGHDRSHRGGLAGTAPRRRRGGSRPRRARTPAGRLGLEVLRPGRRRPARHTRPVHDHSRRPPQAPGACGGQPLRPAVARLPGRCSLGRGRPVQRPRPGPPLRRRGHTGGAPRGERPDLRRVLLDLVEKYARHAGHADLIRASVDGLTGEDPPR